jgi:hypothetical protein
MRPLQLLFMCLSVLTLAATCAADMDLVREGAPRACIIVPADADEMVTLAADELALYVEKMSGAVLPVEQEPPPGVKTVVLGAPDEAWAGAAELSSLTFDGFVVECEGDRLVLAGNVPEGTLNAVYWLLEELGVRWFIPTELGENVPELATVTVPAMNTRVEPTFLCRKNHGIERSIRGHGNVWQRRIRITDMDSNVPFNRYSHNLASILPVSKYGETHPEYYPLINGERRIPTLTHGWQPCTSNPEVVQLAIEAADEWWEKHPEANYFSVGMNDGRGWCECDACTALDIPGYRFRGREVKSERYFTFVKQVAEAVQETHPDKWITCIAYSSVEPVPRGVELPDNVMVVITQDVGAWHDPEYRAEDEALARAWTEAAGAFGVYNYTSQMWLLPRSFPHLMAEALRFYDDIGAVAMTNESWPTWWYAGPMMYARAKLMWDPQQDVDAILDDYYAGFFGPARAPMARLYDRFEETMMTEREGRWFYGINSVPDQIALWTPQQLEDSVADIEEAKRLATAEPFDERVQFVAQGFALTEAILREYWQAEDARNLASRPDVPTERLIDSLKTLAELTARREAIFAEIMQDELLSGTYDRLVNERAGRLTSWKGALNSAYSRVLGALHSRQDVTAEQLEQIAESAGEDVAQQVKAFAWVLEHPDAENLCPNPGFEETAGDAPEGVDWVATGSPPGWSKWSIEGGTDLLTWEHEGGRAEPRCGKIAGAKLATFIAQLTAQPGERYYASIWAKSTGSSEQSPRLEIKWQAPGSGWVRPDANQTVSGEGGTGEWQLLSAIVEVPEDAGRLIMLPRAKDQQEHDVVLLDDARIIRLPDELLGEE